MARPRRIQSPRSGGVATDSIVLLFVKCLVAVVRVAQTMILSRALTQQEYGTYSQALLVISLFAPVFSLGLDSAVNYFFNRAGDDAERERWTDAVFGLSVAAGAIGALLLMVFRDAVAAYYRNAEVAALMAYIALRPCLQNLGAMYQNLYVSSGLSRAVAVRNGVVAVAQVAAVAAAVLITDSLELLFALLLILDVVQVVALSGYYRSRRFAVRPWHVGAALVRPILAYAVPMLLATSVATLSLNLGRLLVSGLMSVEDFALYTNMSQELPFSFVISSFTAVVTPAVVRLLARGDRAAFERLWGDYVELGYLVTWPLCAAAIAAAPQVVELLYSSAYLTGEGLIVFRICMLSCAMRFTYFGLVPTAMGRSRVVFAYSLLSLVLSLPLCAVLFSLFGMLGAAASSAIALIVSSVMYFAKSARLTGASLPGILRARRCAALAIEMAALGFASALLIAFVHPGAFIGTCLAFALVGGGCYLLNGREILRLVRSMNGCCL